MTPVLKSKIKAGGVVAVLVIENAADAVPLVRSLYAGGISVIELTLRTEAALDSLRLVIKEIPEVLAGVGTILTPDQVDAVVDAGAAFGVAPGTNPRILARAKERGLPFGPGIATPTDIEIALEHDCTLLKYFPAETLGGLKHLKNMAAPYLHRGIEFIPLGGINEGNAGVYLKDPLIAAIGGSWLAPKDVIKNKDWATLTENARKAMALVAEARAK
jgi:2-dehydro-3-deoxyphosphogluconate aldolase/(4S)-4-hydroxy-2-oxoglutarate aldolase